MRYARVLNHLFFFLAVWSFSQGPCPRKQVFVPRICRWGGTWPPFADCFPPPRCSVSCTSSTTRSTRTPAVGLAVSTVAIVLLSTVVLYSAWAIFSRLTFQAGEGVPLPTSMISGMSSTFGHVWCQNCRVVHCPSGATLARSACQSLHSSLARRASTCASLRHGVRLKRICMCIMIQYDTKAAMILDTLWLETIAPKDTCHLAGMNVIIYSFEKLDHSDILQHIVCLHSHLYP